MSKRKSLRSSFLFLPLMLLILLTLVSCGDKSNGSSNGINNTITLTYTLPILPVSFAIDSHGHIAVGLGVKITTPLGELSVAASSSITVTPVPDNSLLVVIRHYKDSRLVDSSYRIDVGHGVGNADIKGQISEVKIGWNNGKTNYIFIDASNGDITNIVIQVTSPTPTTTVLTPSGVSTQETIKVDFMKHTTCSYNNTYTGIQTKYTYQGDIVLTVSGVGKAKGNQLSDAFYIYTNEQNKPIDPIHDNVIGAILFINNLPADDFIRSSVPLYTSNHIYRFTIHVLKGKLIFSVGDCRPQNNSGHYTIIISLHG